MLANTDNVLPLLRPTINVDPRDATVSIPPWIMPVPKQDGAGVAAIFADYRTVPDDTNTFCFFELTTTPTVIRADPKKFDPRAGAPVLTPHPDTVDLTGDVTARFKTAAVSY